MSKYVNNSGVVNIFGVYFDMGKIDECTLDIFHLSALYRYIS